MAIFRFQIRTGIGPSYSPAACARREAAEGERICYSPSIVPLCAAIETEVLIPVLYLKAPTATLRKRWRPRRQGRARPIGVDHARPGAWSEEHARWQKDSQRSALLGRRDPFEARSRRKVHPVIIGATLRRGRAGRSPGARAHNVA
jgi:hypothetical protein